MADDGAGCKYVLNPDDPTTWDGEYGDECHVDSEKLNGDGVWECPHATEDEESLCVFHRQDGVSKETIEREFLAAVRAAADDEAERKSQFIGSHIEGLKLVDEELPAGVDSVDFTHASFREPFITFQSTVRSEILFRGADFLGEVSLKQSEFDGKLDFQDAEFHELVRSGGAVFAASVGFPGAEFHEKADFELAEFGETGFFKGTVFRGEVDFSGATFSGVPNFADAKFLEDADFQRTTYEEDTTFSGAVFVSDCTFEQAKFAPGFAGFDEAKFKGSASFNLATFDDVVFGGGVFEESPTFRTAEFTGRAAFKNQTFDEPPDFRGAELPSTTFSDVDLHRADFRRANLDSAEFDSVDLTNTNLEQASLSTANLIGVDLSGARIYGAQMGSANVNTETVFDKHGEERCVYDPHSEYEYDPDDEGVGRLRKAMGTYHLLEQLTRSNTLPDEQAKFFARRQDMRRAQLRQEGRRKDYWLARAHNALFRHGESFSRIVAWSIGTIAAFALLFPLGGWVQSEATGTITYAAIADSPLLLWNSFYHSTLLFLTGEGPLAPTGTAGEILTTIEALIAPILLALLVFVLGRRAAR